MNQVATQSDSRMLAIEDKINRDVSSAIAVGTGGITFQNAGEVMEYAKMMAVSGSAVPKHLRGQPGACLGIIDDAIRFKTSPYALARKSFFVNDNLAYEAQVIAGIINRFAPLKERPNVEFTGEGGERKCIVTFKFLDGSIRTYESPKFKDIYPKNSPLWKNDPDQQHSYYSLRAGARRHCPEVILGMFDVDELRQTIDHRDDEAQPSVMTRLQSRQEAPQAREGFDPAHIASETAALTGEPDSGRSEDISQSSASSPGDGSDGEALSPGQTVAADPSHGDEGAQAGQDGEPASSSDQTGEERAWLIKAAKMLIGAAAPGGDPDIVRRQYAALIKNETPASISQDAIAKANAIGKRMVAVCESTEELDLDLIAGLARCDVAELRT